MLKGKTAFITGGTAGIGRAIATLFANEGAHVAIFGTNKEKATAAIKEILEKRKDPDQKVEAFLVDVSEYDKVAETFSHAQEKMGSVDILVNNAGITRDALFLRMSEEEWDRVMAVNLKSQFNTTKAVLRSMLKSKSGKIINISSVIGLTGNAGQANYAASKAGIIGLTKSLAKEVARKNINVNCIAPGFVETDMTQNLSEPVKAAIMEKIPMHRIGTPLEIAKVALFLASDLSTYMTGQVLTVDGGMII